MRVELHDPNQPASQIDMDILRRIAGSEKVIEMTGKTTGEVRDVITSIFEGLKNRFPLGTKLKQQKSDEILIVEEYVGRPPRVRLRRPNNYILALHMDVLVTATVVELGSSTSRPALWRNLESRIIQVAQQLLVSYGSNHPLDWNNVQNKLKRIFLKDLAKGKAYSKVDPPILSDEELNESITTFLADKCEIYL